MGNEVLSTSEVITESDVTSLQNIFLKKASPRRCPSLRKSSHALVNKPTPSAQCPTSTQIQNKGQVTVVLDLCMGLYGNLALKSVCFVSAVFCLVKHFFSHLILTCMGLTWPSFNFSTVILKGDEERERQMSNQN